MGTSPNPVPSFSDKVTSTVLYEDQKSFCFVQNDTLKENATPVKPAQPLKLRS